MGLLVTCMFLLFSVRYNGVNYFCALVHWFSAVGDTLDDEMGMGVIISLVKDASLKLFTLIAYFMGPT
ncbi:hypothetical protein EDB87DRAFT_766482 [Lactarius vividus]|nr:hypothetical protein EDB87DRAFT_766482 [Lactarius vividus]